MPLSLKKHEKLDLVVEKLYKNDNFKMMMKDLNFYLSYLKKKIRSFNLMPNFVDVTYQQTGKSLDMMIWGCEKCKEERLKKEMLNIYC